jgi:hypothetical protein
VNTIPLKKETTPITGIQPSITTPKEESTLLSTEDKLPSGQEISFEVHKDSTGKSPDIIVTFLGGKGLNLATQIVVYICTGEGKVKYAEFTRSPQSGVIQTKVDSEDNDIRIVPPPNSGEIKPGTSITIGGSQYHDWVRVWVTINEKKYAIFDRIVPPLVKT